MARVSTISFCLGILLGVMLGAYGALPHWGWVLYFICGSLVAGLLLRKHYSKIWWGVWLMIGLVIGNWRLGVVTKIPVDDVSNWLDQTVSIQGIIINDPEITADATSFTVQVEAVDEAIASGKLLVKTRRYPTYQYGNKLNLIGRVSLPSGETESSYSKYLARFNIYARCDFPEIALEQEFVGQPIWRWLYGIKHYWLNLATQVMPEPTSGLLSGLLLGIKAALPEELLNNFNATGLTHIIALSGFNISIVAGAILGLLRWLPLTVRLSGAIVVIWWFVLLTGAAPSALRAAIMGMLILLAGLVGRLADVTISLCLTVAAMVLANPKILLGDIGFQLSFLATIGIIYLSPIIEHIYQKHLPVMKGLLGPTLSALIMVTPILMVNFGRISLIAPLTNVLVVPLIPLAMVLGFAAMVGGMLQTDLGLVLGWLAWAPLKLIVILVNYFSAFPFASINIKVGFGIWFIVYYLAVGSWIILHYVKKKSNPPWVDSDSRSR